VYRASALTSKAPEFNLTDARRRVSISGRDAEVVSVTLACPADGVAAASTEGFVDRAGAPIGSCSCAGLCPRLTVRPWRRTSNSSPSLRSLKGSAWRPGRSATG